MLEWIRAQKIHNRDEKNLVGNMICGNTLYTSVYLFYYLASFRTKWFKNCTRSREVRLNPKDFKEPPHLFVLNPRATAMKEFKTL